jgi:hypothetical protein
MKHGQAGSQPVWHSEPHGAQDGRASAKARLALAAALVLGPALLALCGLLAWRALGPGPYPNAARSQLRLPSQHMDFRGSCWQWTLVDKSYYTAPQDQAHVLTWLKQAGWMGNYRYQDSVLKQTSRRYGPIALARVHEIFVQGRSAGAALVSTAQTTLSIGRC